MTRWPQTVIALALLGATAASFAVTERLKLERSPVTATRVDKVFSPVCECLRNFAVVSFVLRHAETVTVDVLDSSGDSVRTLVTKQREPRGRVAYTWDGRDDAGRLVSDGRYRPRIRLERHGRTIVLPNRITVDSTAPTVTVGTVTPRAFSPDGDGQRDRVTAAYEIDEPARAMMLVDGRRRVFERFRRTSGKLVWYGRIRGREAKPGVYEIRLRAVDQAGNTSARTRAVPVRVRYVELTRNRIEVEAGRRFRVHVLTDAKTYRWRLARRTGLAHRPILVLRAPLTARTYGLYVVVGRHAARAELVVTPSPAP